jgi:hypothetical protein
MGLRHRSLDVEGVQFHPESILTLEGKRLLGNWLASSNRRRSRAARSSPPESGRVSEHPTLRRGAPVLVPARGVRRGHVRAAFDAILAGAWTPVQVGAFAVTLRSSARAPR